VRRLLALLAVVGAALAAPASARAEPLLDRADAAELAQSLAEATDEQGVCYGWRVEVVDDSGGPSGVDQGSSLGPGRPVPHGGAGCARWVELIGTVTYTCDSCEAEDSASAEVTSNLAPAPTVQDLVKLGLNPSGLSADDGDVRLTDMVGALPLVASSKAGVAPVPFEPRRAPLPAGDRPTGGSPLPDWLRTALPLLVAALVCMVGGGIWFAALTAQARREARGRRRPAR
jgi:hypothetical protein